MRTLIFGLFSPPIFSSDLKSGSIDVSLFSNINVWDNLFLEARAGYSLSRDYGLFAENDKIDFNFSHKLCSQCHQQEFKDWKGGAHGKQLGGWAPPRVSNTCVNCHNPHNPYFEKRWPVRFNTQKVKERQ